MKPDDFNDDHLGVLLAEQPMRARDGFTKRTLKAIEAGSEMDLDAEIDSLLTFHSVEPSARFADETVARIAWDASKHSPSPWRRAGIGSLAAAAVLALVTLLNFGSEPTELKPSRNVAQYPPATQETEATDADADFAEFHDLLLMSAEVTEIAALTEDDAPLAAREFLN